MADDNHPVLASTSAYVDIAAPPERVFDVITDITVMPRFSTELVGVQWAEGCTGPALGAKFIGTNRNPVIGEWQTVSEIITLDPPHTFGWAVGPLENPAATWTFDLMPTPAGTRLSYIAQIGPGPSGVTMLIERRPDRARQIVEGRLMQLQTAMSATLAGVRELAETGFNR